MEGFHFMASVLNKITIDPEVCHGKPTIRNTRILVSNILADLADGKSIEEILINYPALTREDILTALDFGSQLSQFETVELEKCS